MFAVCVTFQIQPGMMAQFMPLMQRQADLSTELETGCQQFDVCTDDARPNEVFLYELYDTMEAFQAHLKTEHFRQFELAIRPLIADKVIRTYSQLYNP